jgi:hypothetical protein
MKFKSVYLWIIAVGILIGLSYIFMSGNLSLSPRGSVNSLVCKELYHGSESGINILFFADKDTTEKYGVAFFKTAPFKENKEKFNFFYVDDYAPNCTLYKDIAVFCYSNELIKKASSCQNDFLVVLQDQESSIRSSSYLNVISLNTAGPLNVFAHEFGHAFAALDEEYVPAKTSLYSKNCFSSCAGFSNRSDGCFEGCSNADFYRSIDKGIMRTLYANSYGSFDESILSDKLTSYVSLSPGLTAQATKEPTNDCLDQRYYLVYVKKVNNEIKIVNMTLMSGCAGSNGAGNYHFDVLSGDGTILDSYNFDPRVFTDGQSDEKGMIEGEIFEYDEFALRVPVTAGANSLKIIDDKNSVLAEISFQDINSKVCRIK